MQIVKLYRYNREEGAVTVSPNEPDTEYTVLCRIVADNGYVLTNGEIMTPCIDCEQEEVNLWTEIEDTSKKWERSR